MTGSSNGDIYGALQSLPGTQKVGEDGKLYVRGGEDRETQIFIDGMHVLAPYTNQAQNTPARSRFSPFLFKGINFSLGGYDSEYGQALSSVLPMNTKDVSLLSKCGINFSPLSCGGGGTYSFGEKSLSTNINYSNLSFYNTLLPDRYDWEKNYSKLSGEMQYKQKLFGNGILKIYLGYDNTQFIRNITDELNNSPKRSFDFNQKSYYVNTTYTNKLKNGVKLFIGSAISELSNNYNNARITGDLFKEKSNEIHLKSWITDKVLHSYRIKLGVESYIKKYNHLYRDIYYVNLLDESIKQNIFATFINNQFRLFHGVYGNISGRLEYSNYNEDLVFSPRVSLNYINNNFQVSAIVGKYYQTPRDTLIVKSNQQALNDESALHYILSTSYNNEKQFFRIEAYYKDYRNLSLLHNNKYKSDGYGYSKGIDFYVRDDKTIHNIALSFSLSYNDSKRLFLDYPVKSTPLFCTDINSSLNVKYYISPLKIYIGVTDTYTSGRPYKNPNIPGFINSKTKYFNSLDLNLTYLLNKKVIVYTSLTNVLGRKNVFGYTYTKTGDINGTYNRTPTELSRNRFFYIGIFISLKSDAAYDVSNF